MMNSISGFQSGLQSALTGINRGMNGLQQNAQVIATQSSTDATSDDSLTEAIVGLTANSQQVEASAKALASQDKMLGALLDEMA